MEPRAHHVWIGLATVCIAAAGVVLGIWLADAEMQRERTAYRVVFEESVDGLSTRSTVKLNGINVGEVERLAIAPDDPRRVVADIRISSEVPVREGTRAQIGTSSLFAGGAHIRLQPGDPEAPPLEADNGVPRIPATPSPLAQLRRDSDELLAGINDLVEKGNRLLSPGNIERIEALIAHVEATAGTVAEHRGEIGESLETLAATGAEAERTLRTLRELIEESRALLDGPGERALASTARAAAALERSSEEMEALLQDQRPALERTLEGGQQLEPLARELRQTLEALRSAIRRLEQDPGGRLLRRDRIEEYEP